MAASTLERFHARLRGIEHTRKRTHALMSAKTITRRDTHSMYEALFIRAVVGFEAFCEELFEQIMKQRLRYPKSHAAPLVQCTSWIVMDTLIRGGRNYADWLPYERTIERADAFLLNGSPFKKLNKTQVDTLSRIHVIRNAIVHPSAHARKRFETIAGVALSSGERTPAGYLCGFNAPDQTRLEAYTGELGIFAQTLFGKPKP
ncbi:MAG: hypothetical protein JNM94_02450 [Phycisphaerae bacterium]|nr:hypothetical protein [Phycisphaerae bacterium]